MSDDSLPQATGSRRDTAAEAVLNALPLPVLTIGGDEQILHCNHAAEAFFDYSARQKDLASMAAASGGSRR